MAVITGGGPDSADRGSTEDAGGTSSAEGRKAGNSSAYIRGNKEGADLAKSLAQSTRFAPPSEWRDVCRENGLEAVTRRRR